MTLAQLQALQCCWCGHRPAAGDPYGFEELQSSTVEDAPGTWECIDQDACKRRFDSRNSPDPQPVSALDDPGREPGWVKLPGGAWIEECNLDDLFGPARSNHTNVEQAPGSAWE